MKSQAFDYVRAESAQHALALLAQHGDIEESPLVALHAPLLAQAAPHIAHRAIRNRGTFGGALAYADPAAEWPACVLALGGTLVLLGAGGERRVAADDFFRGLFSTEHVDAQRGEVGARGVGGGEVLGRPRRGARLAAQPAAAGLVEPG